MSRIQLWGRSVPRSELDQRAREARLRLEQVQRLFVGRGPAPSSALGRVLRLVGFGMLRGRSRRITAAGRPRCIPEFSGMAILTSSPRSPSRRGGDGARRPLVPETSAARSSRRARPAGPKAPPAHFARLRAC